MKVGTIIFLTQMLEQQSKKLGAEAGYLWGVVHDCESLEDPEEPETLEEERQARRREALDQLNKCRAQEREVGAALDDWYGHDWR